MAANKDIVDDSLSYIIQIISTRGGRAQPLQFTFKKSNENTVTEKSRTWVSKPRLVSQVRVDGSTHVLTKQLIVRRLNPPLLWRMIGEMMERMTISSLLPASLTNLLYLRCNNR